MCCTKMKNLVILKGEKKNLPIEMMECNHDFNWPEEYTNLLLRILNEQIYKNVKRRLVNTLVGLGFVKEFTSNKIPEAQLKWAP